MNESSTTPGRHRRGHLPVAGFLALRLATSCAVSHDASLPDPLPLTDAPFSSGTVAGIGYSAIWMPTAEGCLRLETAPFPCPAPPAELSIIHEEGAFPGSVCVGASVLHDSSDCIGLSADDPSRPLVLESGQLVLRMGRDEAGRPRTNSLDAVWEREDGERIRVRTDEIGVRWSCPPL